MKYIYYVSICILLSMSSITANEYGVYFREDETDQNIIIEQTDTQINQTANTNGLHAALQNLRTTIQTTIAYIMSYIHYFAGTDTTIKTSEEEIRSILIHRNGEQQPNPRKERIIAHVAKIISGILNIARDPHNAQSVGDSVGTMVQGIISITVDAIKDKKEKQLVRAHLEKTCIEITEELEMLFKDCSEL